MAKGLAFYSSVFQRKPTHIEDRYSYFDLDGFYFGLLNEKAEDRPIIRGNNSVLAFHVDDLEAEHKRLQKIVPFITPDFLTLPTVRLFEFKDIDDNLIEVFEVIA